MNLEKYSKGKTADSPTHLSQCSNMTAKADFMQQSISFHIE